MVLPFGVSIGDFVCTIGLIRDVVGALADSQGSASEYQDLAKSLDASKAAAARLKKVVCEDAELARQLQRSTEQIDDMNERFESKIAKYQPSLSQRESSRKWLDALRKVQFRLIKEDIRDFKINLLVHASIAYGLLDAVRAADQQNQLRAAREPEYPLVGAQEELVTKTQRSLDIALAQHSGDQENRLVGTMKALTITLHQDSMLRLPRRIYFEEPVVFQDACGLYFPIYTEWVSDWEAFHEGLERKFKNRPGLEAVLARNYKLQDGSIPDKWYEIDMNEPYEKAFKPGGRCDMAIVFPRDQETDSGCPKCGRSERAGAEPSRIECQNPGCRTTWNRASDDYSDVFELPQHYDMPNRVRTVHDPAGVGGDDGSDIEGTQTQVQHPGPSGDDSVVDEALAEVIEMSGNAPTTIATSTNANVRMDDFVNIYLARSPPVYVKALSGTWYVLPWPVFQTYEGFRFLAQYFCGAVGATFTLRDWNADVVFGERNWNSQVYFGMVAEMIFCEASHASPSYDVSSSTGPFNLKAKVHGPGPTATTKLICPLCRKTFFNRGTFKKHARGHLKRKDCPNECTICQQVP